MNMQERKELIKTIVAAIGPLIDAKNEMLKTVLLAEIKAAETRIRKDMATKEDIKRLEQKVERKLDNHEGRISQLETGSAIPHSH